MKPPSFLNMFLDYETTNAIQERAIIPGLQLDCMESLKRLAVIKCSTFWGYYKEPLYLKSSNLWGSSGSLKTAGSSYQSRNMERKARQILDSKT